MTVSIEEAPTDKSSDENERGSENMPMRDHESYFGNGCAEKV
jgi:hypothetical protein